MKSQYKSDVKDVLQAFEDGYTLTDVIYSLMTNKHKLSIRQVESAIKYNCEKFGMSKSNAIKYAVCSSLIGSDFITSDLLDKTVLIDRQFYLQDPFFRDIKISNENLEGMRLDIDKFSKYESTLFNHVTFDDMYSSPSFAIHTEEVSYPTLFEGNEVWMSITPAEINSMKSVIAKAHGKVITYGLGLGYFAYLSHLKSEVVSITVVEKDTRVIDLFVTYILPQFKYQSKIKIIHGDVFNPVVGNFDYCFVDTWKDYTDPEEFDRILSIINIYSKLKQYPVDYWIEDSIIHKLIFEYSPLMIIGKSSSVPKSVQKLFDSVDLEDPEQACFMLTYQGMKYLLYNAD